MKKSTTTACLLLLTYLSYAQCDPSCGPNLVPNGDFEEVDPVVCQGDPSSELWSDQSPVANWIGASTSTGFSSDYTPDYFNPDCGAANPADGVNQSFAVGIFTVTFTGIPASEWFQVQLSEPLEAGQLYCVSFFAASYESIGFPGDGLDVAILESPVVQDPLSGDNPTSFTPAYSNPPNEFIPLEFTEYTFNYCAEGGEEWLAFGNQNADQTNILFSGSQAYVIIDDVSLSESCTQSNIGFEITSSQPVIGCNDCSTLQAVDDNGTVINVDWSDGLGLGVSTVDVCPDETTTYTATFLSEACDGSEVEITQEVTVEVDCNDDFIVNLEGGTICPGESFSLLAEVSGGVPDYDFQWSPEPFGNGAGPYDVSPDETTTYQVVATDAAGTVVEAEATVVVSDETLDLNLPPVLDLCDGPVILDASNTGGTEFLWSDGSTNPTLTVEVAGTYSVEVSNACAAETAEIEVEDCEGLVVTLEGGAICEGGVFELVPSVSGGTPPYTSVWTPGGTSGNVLSVSPSASTTYTVVVTDANNLSVEATALVEVVSSATEIDLGNDRFICPDDTLVLDANLGENFDYLWSDGSSLPQLEVTQEGVYRVRVETPCAVLRDTVTITEAIPDFNYAREVKACLGEEVEIGPAESEEYTVIWSDGEMTNRKIVSQPGRYSGSLTSEECPAVVPVEVEVELLNCDCHVYIPNAFTPNADGLNDVFKVVPDCDIETYSLRIYNRWGNEVFASDSPLEVWNGASADADYFVQSAVFSYILTIQPRNELFAPEPIVLRGTVTVLR